MNGEEGETAREVRKFAERVAEATGLPYFFWDERLSSSAVESMMIKEADLSRARRKKSLDAGAAAYILQGVLDAMKFVCKGFFIDKITPLTYSDNYMQG